MPCRGEGGQGRADYMRDRDKDKMKLILIRHGATLSNECGKYLSRTDEGLSQKGITDIQEKQKNGKYPPAKLVASSPMKRCRQTAELIYKCKPSILTEEWKEINFGRFEGKDYKQLTADPYYQRWIDSNGKLPFPEGESREEFIKRCVIGFQGFCNDLCAVNPVPEAAALIVHGGTIMAILSTYSKEDYYSFQCGNGEGYSCEFMPEKTNLIRKIDRL